MRRIHKRLFFKHYRSSNNKNKRFRRLALTAVAIFLFWTVVSEVGLSAVCDNLTEETVRGFILSQISATVNDELSKREKSFVSVTRNEYDEITSVSVNTNEMNTLKTGILSVLGKKLNDCAIAYVPIGSFTSVAILNGRGPKVPLKLNLECSSDIYFATELVSAGINQSSHRITMTVRVRCYSQSKRFETEIEEQTTTVLAETLVVGAIPNVALTETFTN